MYDYRAALEEDIRNYINNYWDIDELKEMGLDRAEEMLENEMWESDEVTGNMSFYASETECEQYLVGNLMLALDVLEEFGGDFHSIPREAPAQYLDATIRCYLLGEVLYKVLRELFDEEDNNESE